MNLGQFLGLPMMAGPRDIPMGEDELGNILYAAGGTPSGQRYTKKTAPANRASVVKALVKGAKAKPWETVGNLVTGAAQGAWDAVSAPGRSLSDTVTYGDVANTAGLVSLPAVAGKYDPAVANMGIRAYHGSPHDFDRFDMSKIGTGEGAQAYGHGLYFAEAEDVARQYRNKLGTASDGKMYIGGDLVPVKKGGIQPGTKDDIIYRLWKDRRQYQLDTPQYDWPIEYTDETLDTILNNIRPTDDVKDWAEKVIRGKSIEIPPAGRMYEVDIKADPADFLDWDAPLSEQPEKVRRGFTEATLGKPDPILSELMDESGLPNDYLGLFPASSGAQAYNTSSRGVGELEFTERLKNTGIPGIKYYDQGSRAGKEGTRNYVVFDDSLIEILRKYGLAGALPLGAILGTQDDEKQRIRDFLSQ